MDIAKDVGDDFEENEEDEGEQDFLLNDMDD